MKKKERRTARGSCRFGERTRVIALAICGIRPWEIFNDVKSKSPIPRQSRRLYWSIFPRVNPWFSAERLFSLFPVFFSSGARGNGNLLIWSVWVLMRMSNLGKFGFLNEYGFDGYAVLLLSLYDVIFFSQKRRRSELCELFYCIINAFYETYSMLIIVYPLAGSWWRNN